MLDKDLKNMRVVDYIMHFLVQKGSDSIFLLTGNGAMYINDAIAKFHPDFETKYSPDQRQNIAASWPNSIDDSRAREEWNWKPEFGTKELVESMLNALSN